MAEVAFNHACDHCGEKSTLDEARVIVVQGVAGWQFWAQCTRCAAYGRVEPKTAYDVGVLVNAYLRNEFTRSEFA